MITEKEEIIQRIKKLEKKLRQKDKKIDRLIHEIECMTLAFIEHYSLNRQMVHTKSVKMKTAEEKKKQIEKKMS